MSAAIRCPVCMRLFASITGNADTVCNRLVDHLALSHNIHECPCSARNPSEPDYFARHLETLDEDIVVHFTYHALSQTECPQCHKVKNDVMERPDHYAREIHGEDDATMISCDECENQNAQDI